MWGPFCDIPDIVANLEVDEDEFRFRHNKEANEREEQPSSQERRHADTFESIAGTTEGGVRQPRSCPRGRIRKPEWMNNCKGRARGLTSVTTMTTMERAGVAYATSEKEYIPMNV